MRSKADALGDGAAPGGAAPLDPLDRRILALLERDGRRSYAEIAQQVGLSAPSVHARVKKLEERRVVRGYAALLDPAALGFPLAALVAVRQAPGYYWEELERAFASFAAVEACYSVTGEDSYLLRVRVADPRELEELLRRINAVEGVAATRTLLVLSTTFERQRTD